MANVPRNNEADAIVKEQSTSTIGKREAVVQVDSKVVAHPNNRYTFRTKQGNAIVINQERFHHNLMLPTRDGTIKDGDDVCEILKKLGFEVQVLNDPSKRELFAQLEKNAEENHTNNDCFLAVVMTHGDSSVLYAKDQPYDIDELWNNFTGDSCKTLHGKPKLFFIQGSSHEKPHTNNIGKSQKTETDGISSSISSTTSNSTSSLLQYTIPKTADLLVMYSTYDGYKPWRDTSNGSWFIQSLCAMLEAHGHTKGLLRILTAVSQSVLNNYRQFVPIENGEQMYALKKLPFLFSTLTKSFYFNPKNVNKGTVRTLNADGPAKNSDEAYNIQNMNRKAYIFHRPTLEEEAFHNGRESGTNDPDKLKTALERLDFTVDGPFMDLKPNELEEKMKSIASENHEDTGCILFAIMTCGKDNLLFAKDDTHLVRKLINRFSNSKCPTLSGKPKVFLIQACTNGITHSISFPPTDVVVLYSFYNELADRNELAQPSPTVFIQTLCKELDANGKVQELNSMLDKVRRNIDEIADMENQEAVLVSKLSKKLYFH